MHTLKEWEEMEGQVVECPCEECGEWTVGERRCSCGNIRISLESFDGTSYYPDRC